MLQENMSSIAHHGLLMYVQKNIQIIEKQNYPGITFEIIKAHVLKVDMPFTVIGIYKAPRMTLQKLKKKLSHIMKHDDLSRVV